uniref:Uncharacterized protein n=1 Tax=Arundo donax TaxID=35708 RepID=A0A0A9C270_ARUDO
MCRWGLRRRLGLGGGSGRQHSRRSISSIWDEEACLGGQEPKEPHVRPNRLIRTYLRLFQVTAN